ncbi:hypothetical protein [Thermococcus sp. AM4]|uniref:hypothetical protein n=1 Tax=Thermococcus sp. (strain AM4) TaxID=246969 RepID=UPI00022998DA|nr:hypothetical protein [Thermococcus sp. AM4]EEB73812.2 Hypothetical protein TAM4_100 [Thermococcus sp. AM4]
MKKLFPIFVLLVGLGLVSATPQFPLISPEEASSLGLRISYGGGGDVPGGGSNSYQDFICLNDHEPYTVITLMATYYPDGRAEEEFRAYYQDFMGRKDKDVETYRVHYEISGGDDYFVVLQVEEYDYEDSNQDQTVYWYYYYALVRDYIVTLNTHYSTRYYQTSYSPPCDISSLLPRLFNLYLSKFEGNIVRVPENVSSGQGNVSEGSGNPVGSPVGGLSPEARARMSKTTARIASLGDSIEVQTPSGKLVKLSSGKASTALGWKAKYYGNKALDSLIDGASSLLPSPLGLFRDYVRGYKDSLVFNESESVRKTAKDLHVSGKSASLYNKMNSIEAREKALSPYKNAVPTSIATKPIETVLSSMGLAVKKTLAQDYEWEFRKTAETALRYRKMGLKYSEVIRNTVDEVMDTTQGMNRVHMLNRNSGGKYSDQEARIRFYINQLFEEGRI